jgi:hypothetical protein
MKLIKVDLNKIKPKKEQLNLVKLKLLKGSLNFSNKYNQVYRDCLKERYLKNSVIL